MSLTNLNGSYYGPFYIQGSWDIMRKGTDKENLLHYLRRKLFKPVEFLVAPLWGNEFILEDIQE